MTNMSQVSEVNQNFRQAPYWGMAASSLPLLIIAAVADAETLPNLSIADVIARHEQLDGQRVRVSGWLLDKCYRFGCSIRASREADSPTLRIGESADFDEALISKGAQGHRILIEGRVKHDCFDHPKGDPRYDPKFITVCTDRGDQLADPKLITVLQDKS
jgi:hypothetical protein